MIVKVFAVDEKGNPIEYLAYEVPAPRKLLTDRLHHLLISLHWRARISTPSGTRGAVDVRRRPPRKMASSRSWLSSRIVESVADAGSQSTFYRLFARKARLFCLTAVTRALGNWMRLAWRRRRYGFCTRC